MYLVRRNRIISPKKSVSNSLDCHTIMILALLKSTSTTENKITQQIYCVLTVPRGLRWLFAGPSNEYRQTVTNIYCSENNFRLNHSHCLDIYCQTMCQTMHDYFNTLWYVAVYHARQQHGGLCWQTPYENLTCLWSWSRLTP